MKLIVQIPCLNEEASIAATIRDVPRTIDGLDVVEILVIDDGSTDRTAKLARQAGADHVISFKRNRGLGHAMAIGLEHCLNLGADVIVNTDGDNQYCGADVPLLVAPILNGCADIVIGDRGTATIAEFSFMKKLLQQMGSRIVSQLAALEVPDVASGFRSYSREVALNIVDTGSFDHTVEHTIRAGQSLWTVVSVPIRTNPKARNSRLFTSVGEFVLRSGLIGLRTYATYQALRVFSITGITMMAVGVMLGLRFMYFLLFTKEGELHVQSIVLAAVFLLAGFQVILTGVIADLIGTNRVILEDMRRRVRVMEMRDFESGATNYGTVVPSNEFCANLVESRR